MKRKVTFEKKIDFPSMIGEISAISLEHDLKFVDISNVEGNLLLKGKYKQTEASRLEEDFFYKIPVFITLTEQVDLNTINIEIVDFFYEIENENTMVCHIDLSIEGEEVLPSTISEEVVEDRECDGDVVEYEEEVPILDSDEKSSEVISEKNIAENELEDIISEQDSNKESNIDSEKEETSLFQNLEDDKDSFGTFVVYIIRQNETVNSILEKYTTTLEELEKYNDLNNLNIGSKVIIPLLNDE